ncbi:MAG: 5-formyltetrahydrofolate cyclo-ligase [Gemmatimonadota bacterium]
MTTKAEVRQQGLAAREGVPDRAAASRAIQARVMALPEFSAAATILTYMGVRTEVATEAIVAEAVRLHKKVAAPYVTPDGLHAALIEGRGDLVPARFGLVEPADRIKQDPLRACTPGEVDLFVIPGLAFDRSGGRVGFGRAYYDRLLARASARALFVAVCFHSQLVPTVPMIDHDIRMHVIITERETIYPKR